MTFHPIPETKNRYAVCVGINHYAASAQTSHDLLYAERDAQAIYELLLQHEFLKDNSCLLLGNEATLEAIYEALENFILTKPGIDDLVIFYFAGHGLPISIDDSRNSRCEVFLPAHNFDRQKITRHRGAWLDYRLRMGRLRKDIFEETLSEKVLFLFDCCYSGDFHRQTDRDGETLASHFIAQPFAKSSVGRVVVSSSLPYQKSRENDILKHGVFTYHLLEALEGRIAEAIRPNGWVTVGSLFDCLSEKLPENQRPVKSGIELDTFRLLYFPAHDKHSIPDIKQFKDADQKSSDKQVQLRVKLTDHTGFMHELLSSFMGRKRELEDIRQRIAAILPTGGYITITGQAGQGKSSIIAKLVQEYDPEKTAYHFIPLNPGPDYQVSLLRDLMARLTLKYDLNDVYVASENRPILRAYFPKVLAEVVARGGQEVIFVDGLDQLKEDLDGERDLSFLPAYVPEGVVFILGTRPNETLEPLKLLKPHDKYNLPNLSRQDFDLILEHRGVRLDKTLVDQFYRAMQENALYLDLVAKELAQEGAAKPEEIIKRVTDNPENIFSLSIERLYRKPNDVEWSLALKPILGILLVAHEPMTTLHLREILQVRGITEIDDHRLRKGLERLGGLVANDGRDRYSLFHLKLYDYLRQDENNPHKEHIFAMDEEESWNANLANWCKLGSLASIWEDVKHNPSEQSRRDYARWHYITHLYDSRNWSLLFSVLDEGVFGQSKVHFDPSSRSYAQDLDLGRRAAAWEKWTLEEGLELLPRLWRYTLLRCSLASRADRYPLAAFRLLVLLNRTQVALGLAKLVTSPARKVSALFEIAGKIGEQPGREQEYIEMLQTINEDIYLIKDSSVRAKALENLAESFIQIRQSEQAASIWSEAKAVIHTIEEDRVRVQALHELDESIARGRRWERAEEMIRTIEEDRVRAQALRELDEVLPWKQEEDHTDILWAGVEMISYSVEERARAVIYTFSSHIQKAEALANLGEALARTLQWERAASIWSEAEAVIRSIELDTTRAQELKKFAEVLIRVQQWQQAEAVIRSIELDTTRAQALAQLGEVLALAQQLEWAEAVIRSIELDTTRAQELKKFAEVLIRVQQWQQAEAVIRSIELDTTRAQALAQLGEVLALAQQLEWADKLWADAETIAYRIEENQQKYIAFGELGKVLARAGKRKQVEELWAELEAAIHRKSTIVEKVEAYLDLGYMLVHAQEWKRAQQVLNDAADLIINTKEFHQKSKALNELDGILMRLAEASAQAQEWELAKEEFGKVRNNLARAKALIGLSEMLWRSRESKLANDMWTEAESTISMIEDDITKAEAMLELGEVIARAQQWVRAQSVIQNIEIIWTKVRALRELGEVLAWAHELKLAESVWSQARELIQEIKERDHRVKELQELGQAFARAKQWVHAEVLWAGAGAEIRMIGETQRRDLALGELGAVLVQAQQWNHAESLIHTIQNREQREQALSRFGQALARVQEWERARTVIRMIGEDFLRVEALTKLGEMLVHSHQWENAKAIWAEAEAIIRSIQEHEGKAKVLERSSEALAREYQWERAIVVWTEAEAQANMIEERAKVEIRSIEENERRVKVLGWPSKVSEQEHQLERAEIVRTEARVLIDTIKEQAKAEIRSIEASAKTVIQTLKESDQKAEALGKLGEILARAQQWERAEIVWAEAEAVIRTVEESDLKAEALWKLGEALARIQQWERAEIVWAEAETVIRKIKEREQRAWALGKLSEAIAWAQQWGRAQTIINTIEGYEFKTEALEKLSEALIRAQEWEHAEKVILTIEESWTKARSLGELSEALANAEQWDRAESVIHKIKKSEQRAWALGKLGQALARSQQWERAETMISRIEENEQRTEALLELGESLARAQELERAKGVWKEAAAIIRTIQKPEQRAWSLAELGEILAGVQELEWAKVVWKEAEAVVSTIEEREQRAWSLGKLCEVLARAKQWEYAKAVIPAIKNREQRATALGKLGESLARAQELERAKGVWKEAAAIIRTVQKPEQRAWSLAELGEILAGVQELEWAKVVWKEAEAVVSTIEEREQKEEALRVLVEVLARAQEWEYAEALMLTMQNNDQKALALSELANVLAIAGEYDRLLHLVQNSWLRADTREYAIKLLPLVNRLISLKPEIGLAFYETFVWVDNFLQT